MIISKRLLRFIAGSALMLQSILANADDALLGVLEDVPGVYSGESNSYEVRALFHKNEKEWVSYESDCKDQECLRSAPSKYPKEVDWLIVFNGRSLGNIKAATPSDFRFYAHIGLQNIVSTGTIPTVGKPSMDFSGWSGSPVHRPLVAVSKPNYSDPDHWRPTPISNVLSLRLKALFKKKYPHLCRTDPNDETKGIPVKIQDAKIEVEKSYKSKSGWTIAALSANGLTDCDDKEAGFGIDNPTYVTSPNGASSYIGSGLQIIDAGDYDADGHSEVLFSISGYDLGGYKLFFNDFKQHATFQFLYH